MIEKMLTVSVKNQIQPINWHECMELDFVLRGAMDVVRNNRTFHVESGELMVLNRGDIHSISSDSDDLLYIQLHFNLEKYNQYIPEIWTVLFYCSPEENDAISRNLKNEIKSRISNIVHLMDGKSGEVDAKNKILYYSIDILSSLKMGFLATVDRQKNLNEEQINRVWKVIDYIYDNCNRKLKLDEVAKQVFVSGDYLTKLLKRNSGIGFEEFIAMVRSEISIKLLLTTDMSVSAIAYECGFSALRYYNNAFLKSYGCTPAEYRENNRNNFIIEKQRKSTGLICDENADKEYAMDQLQEYEMAYEEDDSRVISFAVDFNKPESSGKLIEDIAIPQMKKMGVWNYSVQKALSSVLLPCICPENNVYVCKEQDTITILLVNSGEMSGMEFTVTITGLDETGVYAFCREKTPDIPESILKIIDTGNMRKLNRVFVDNIFNMTYEYGEITSEAQIYMNIELKYEQLERIIIQKVK